MQEQEPSDPVLSSEDALSAMAEAERPISEDDLQLLKDNLKDWYFNLGELHRELVEKYGQEMVNNTRLHHILSFMVARCLNGK